jgi:asparagine synthase (glutamine-hydrolysing)
MCGIAGLMMRDGSRPDTALLNRLAAALAHRGPDGNGRFISAPIGLAHTRLAIVDLVTGAQPLYANQGAVLVANGEIYNDPEIRAQMNDVHFATGSDCEAPLHLYQKHGIAFADFLRGMYAIAIYDPANARLLLARDPFGIKPLYYVESPSCFVFASEPQALLAAGVARRSLRPRARAELMQLKFTTGANMIFSSIRRVLPGETLVVTRGQISERRRRPALPEGSESAVKYEEALRLLDEILADSVAHHLRADVPYGLFLSGGVDSGSVIGLMARLSAQPVIAFTASFPGEAAADERLSAERIARSVGARHHVVEMTARDFWCQAAQVAAALDDPTTDPAALPTYLLAKAAKDQVKVVLTGEGGDEIFCGYSRYYRSRRFWGMFARHARSRGEFDGLGQMKGAFDGWRDGLNLLEHQRARGRRTFIQTLQEVDCAEWLPNDLLIKLDRCLMAHGLEGRTPFLDPVVAGFAFHLPDSMKATTTMAKRLLRDWLAVNFPASEPYAKKAGFNPPVGAWIAARQPLIEDLVARQPGIRELFAREAVASAFADLNKRYQAAWSLLFYALWHSHHVLELPCNGTIEDVLAQAGAAA